MIGIKNNRIKVQSIIYTLRMNNTTTLGSTIVEKDTMGYVDFSTG